MLTCYNCQGKGFEQLKVYNICNKCHGAGKSSVGLLTIICSDCHGTGNISKTIEVTCYVCHGTRKTKD